MKRKIAGFIAVFSVLITALLLYLKARPIESIETGWYPFVIPERLDPDSPVNMGRLVLDPPAGKHGFVKAQDGAFVFEDGTPIRFWGTNLCFNACFPTHEQAEILANRIAFFGFNAVRLHHMDFYFEPRGIFEDTAPDNLDPQAKKTGKLSPAQLDRLDFFIYQLKRRGIYVDMNLLVRRQFTSADGIADAEKFTGAAKPASMFDPKMIELQKEYAKALLTHYNPYTKLRYCDDPVIAMIEITNENSMSLLRKKKMPDYYEKQLADMRERWQASLTASSGDKEGFYKYAETKYIEEMVAFLRKALGVKTVVTGIGGYAEKIDLEAQRACDFIDSHAYWDHPKFPGRQWDGNNFRIHNKSVFPDKDAGIIGKLAKKNSPVTELFHNGSSKPFTVTEWNHCYPNRYAYETPLLLATEAVRNRWAGLFQFAFSHGWKTEPAFDDIHSYFDAIANPQQLILCSLGSYIMHSPVIARNNATSVIARAEGPKQSPDTVFIDNGIAKISSPSLIAAIGNLKNRTIPFDGVDISSEDNGTIALLSLDGLPIAESGKILCVTVGEVKNTGSGWKNGRFDWGGAPVLLKKVDAVVTLRTVNGLTTYALDEKGTAFRAVARSGRDGRITLSTKGLETPWFAISAK